MGKIKIIDLTGKKIGEWTVLSFASRNPKTRQVKWNCRCVCGIEKEVLQGSLQQGLSKSCGCSKPKGEDNVHFKHGLSHKNKAWRSWTHIKARCYNPNHKNYATYGGAGIKMEPEWIEDFTAFYAEIGDAPEDSKYWSVERIDTTRGYIKGNVKWANQDEQCKNRRKQKNNTSGVVGVQWKVQGNFTAAIAQWKNLEGRHVTKCFSVNKYGLLPAFKLAYLCRQQAIKELNSLGAGYKDSHGK